MQPFKVLKVLLAISQLKYASKSRFYSWLKQGTPSLKGKLQLNLNKYPRKTPRLVPRAEWDRTDLALFMSFISLKSWQNNFPRHKNERLGNVIPGIQILDKLNIV